jgi:hypothetical protein
MHPRSHVDCVHVTLHTECDIIKEEALAKLQAAWNSSEQKDEWIVCLNDLERAYWMGTEIWPTLKQQTRAAGLAAGHKEHKAKDGASTSSNSTPQ